MKRSNQSRLIYRTDKGSLCPQCQRRITECVCGQNRPESVGDGITRIRRETKGRSGKVVTIIDGLPAEQKKMKTLCTKLKRKCGAGGAVKGDAIEIQGDKRDLCSELLESLGYRTKLSGG